MEHRTGTAWLPLGRVPWLLDGAPGQTAKIKVREDGGLELVVTLAVVRNGQRWASFEAVRVC